jgi:hypothetical protein
MEKNNTDTPITLQDPQNLPKSSIEKKKLRIGYKPKKTHLLINAEVEIFNINMSPGMFQKLQISLKECLSSSV